MTREIVMNGLDSWWGSRITNRSHLGMTVMVSAAAALATGGDVVGAGLFALLVYVPVDAVIFIGSHVAVFGADYFMDGDGDD